MCDQQSLRSACAYAQSDQSRCLSLEYSMIVNVLTEHHLECLSFKGGCTGLSESTLVKMPHCRKSHVTAHLEGSPGTVGLMFAVVLTSATLSRSPVKSTEHKGPKLTFDTTYLLFGILGHSKFRFTCMNVLI